MPTGKARRSATSPARHIRKAPEVRPLYKANGHLRTDVLYLILAMMTGEPERAMESAKQLIGLPEGEVPTAPFAQILNDTRYKEWSRIAAAYTLGFLPMEKQRGHQLSLRKALGDTENSVRVRSHAAEALGNLRDSGATALLKDRLLDAAESNAVRRWCIYALGEISSPEARRVLHTFAQTRPQGVLATEMNMAYEAMGVEVA